MNDVVGCSGLDSFVNTDWAASYRGHRVLITGARGFIGRWVARLLSAAGADLRLVTRSADDVASLAKAFGITGEWISADLTKPGAFAAVFSKCNPDFVFNVAGYGVDPQERDPATAEAINCEMVREIAETIADSGDTARVRLINVGSAAEYGPVDGPLTELSPENPVSIYGQTKQRGTAAVINVRNRACIAAVTARLFTVYGPGEHASRLLPSLMRAASEGQRLALSEGNQARDFTYVEDAAEGLLRVGACRRPLPGVVNVATGTLTSVRNFVLCASELLHMGTAQLGFGELPRYPEEVKQGSADTTLLNSLTGWRPKYSIAQGIQRTIDFVACSGDSSAGTAP